MRRRSFLIALMALCHVFAGRVWSQETSASGNSALLDYAARRKEARRAEDLEFLHKLVNRVKGQERVSIPDNSSIEDTIGRLIEDSVLGLTAAQRQELVKKTIGEADYLTLNQLLTRALRSSDRNQQTGAIALLGYPLFASEATDQIKAFVFHADRMTQYLAVRSLVYLDVAGANALLKDMIRSGALMDYELSQAINALYISNDKGLDNLAMALLERNPGGMTFKSLLPILKKRADYHEVVSQVFKSDMFYVPDREDLPMEQRWKALAEHDLLKEIFSDPKSFMMDEAIKKKVLMYASTDHNNLSTLALLILEKSGQELGYFSEMLKNNQLSAQKKRVLDLIIARIQKDERLK